MDKPSEDVDKDFEDRFEDADKPLEIADRNWDERQDEKIDVKTEPGIADPQTEGITGGGR